MERLLTVKLRVCLVHWTFPPTTGGVESHLWDLARMLSAAGCAVTVVTGEAEPVGTGEFSLITCPLLNLDRIRDGEPAGAQHATALADSLEEIFRHLHANIVHGHNLHHFSPHPALVIDELRRTFGYRIHHTFHETWPDLLQHHPVYRTWDGNYAVSAYVQDQCKRRLDFLPRLFPLGIDTTRFRARRAAFSRRPTVTILHPARLLPWKGVDVSIRMLAELRESGLSASLVITDTQRIADWNRELIDYRRNVERLVAELGLAEAVSYTSAQYSDMPELYQGADVVVYPTIGQEPYGLVPLEAMACERAVVVTRSGGMSETVIDGVTGYVVEPGDVSGLAEAVGRLVRQPELARQFGAAGAEHVRRHFDSRRYVERLLACYGSR